VSTPDVVFDSSLGVVVFDRDDTLINDCGQHNNKALMSFNESAIRALKLISQSGYGTALATNQSGLATGKFTLETMNEFHSNLQEGLIKFTGKPLDLLAICPHSKELLCGCRKPETGLLETIEFVLGAKVVLFIGNSESDLETAQKHGVDAILFSESDIDKSIKGWLGIP
jgi:D-glycero-D-manno-heptose 1,7-bisphosphate phosphatase